MRLAEIQGRANMLGDFQKEKLKSVNIERKLKVLVAEDNPMNQKIIEILIKTRGWDYYIAADGEIAVKQFKDNHYDVVLMDINMPNMNGFDATLKIRETDKMVPIIAITAFTDRTFRQKSAEVGMNYFICKPYRKDELFNAIAHCLPGKDKMIHPAC